MLICWFTSVYFNLFRCTFRGVTTRTRGATCLTLTIDHKREMGYSKIGVFAFHNDTLHCFVFHVKDTPAFLAYHPHMWLLLYDNFVLCGMIPLQPMYTPQNLCRNEQLQRIIYRSARQVLCFALFFQFFGREERWQLEDQLQHYLTFGRVTHLMAVDILVQPFECLFIW